MKINYSIVLVFIILGPHILTVLLGVIGIALPSEMTLYLISLFAIFILNIKLNCFSIIFLSTKVALYSYVFCVIVLIFAVISISKVFVYEKMILLFYLVIVKILVISLLNFNYIFDNYLKLIRYMKNFSMFIISLYFIFYIFGYIEYFNPSSRVYLVGTENPIWFSRFIVDLVFIIIFYSVYVKKISIYYYFCFIFSIFLLFKAGSRGPALSLFIVCLFLILNTNPSRKRLFCFLFAVFFLIVGPFIIQKISNFNIFSLYSRLGLYTNSIDYIFNNPFGYGLGSFGLLNFGEDIRNYPHNIILEVFLEFGILGAIVFALLAYSGVKTYACYNVFFYLFLISLINAQFSGDLASNNYVFIYLFLSSLYKVYERRVKDDTVFMCHGKYFKQ